MLHVAAPGMAGGLESVVLELTAGMRGLGHRVILAATVDADSSPPLLAHAADRGVDVRRLPIQRRAYLSEYRQLKALMAELAPQVVHTHGYRADLIGGLAARRSGVPWVTTVHGFTGGDLKNQCYEFLQTRAYRRARAVLAVSAPLRVRLVEHGVPTRLVHELPNAWASRPGLSRAEARHRLGLGDQRPVIGWVGRLTREKGADLFLDALARLPHRDWTASIIGDGRERPALEAQARGLGIAERVRWHGLQPDAGMLFAAFDVWVLSSRTEGTPMALFEAMAAHVPIVVTTVGGVPDVVSDAEALRVPPDTPGALAAAIAEALADPERRSAARVEAAAKRLAEGYAPADWFAAHQSLYQSLARAGAAEP
jgi:glycosyltransferase involved in cell wall biosynthesis